MTHILNSTLEDSLNIKSDERVKQVIEDYPMAAQKRLEEIRQLIIEVAREEKTISIIEETLKWGEPSYLVKKGSTIRIDWKEKNPDSCYIFFKCTSQLVPTFKKVYGDQLKFEGNRAVIIPLKGILREDVLKNCIRATLMYHRVKHLNNLGLKSH